MSSKGKGKETSLPDDESKSPRDFATDGKGGSGINRVNRACNHCRRMKMRCVGADDPPCKRCRVTGEDCVMEKPRKGTSSLDAPGGDDRIKHLEYQVTSIQSTLADLVTAIKSSSMVAAPTANTNSVSPQGYYPSPASSHQRDAAGKPVSSNSSQPGGHQRGQASNNNAATGAQMGIGGMNVFDEPVIVPNLDGFGSSSSTLPGGTSNNSNNPNVVVPRPDSLMRLNNYGSSATNASDYRTSFDTSNTRGSMRLSSFSGPGPRDTLDPRNTSNPEMLGKSTHPAQMWDEGGFAIPNRTGFGEYTNNTSWDYQFEPSGIASLLPGDTPRDLQTQHQQHSSTTGLQPVGALTPGRSRRKPEFKSSETSVNASPTNSDGEEEDGLVTNMITAPLANMSSMAGLAEAAVERARAERSGIKSGPGAEGGQGGSADEPGRDSENKAGAASRGKAGKRGAEQEDAQGGGGDRTGDNKADDGRQVKKRKTDRPDDAVFVVPKDPIQRAAAALNPPGIIVESHRSGKGKKTRKHVHAFPDVVSLGVVHEEEARQLFDLYFSGSNAFLPIYDPDYDTWDSLRLRSPFSLSAIVAVGARVRDGGGPISEVQRASTEHARKIGLGTMWTPVARIEAVQATLVLAGFSQNGWLPSGHAVRLGLDMEINHSFMKLLRGRMGAGKTPAQLEEERDLVIQARCWFTLYMIEHQMSYGTGRPAILREDASIAECRRFLDHPLSIATDVRLISTVEMIALRAPLHIVLTTSPEEPVSQETVVRLQQANGAFDRWLTYWERVMIERYGKTRNDFFMESLLAQRSYASLFINSQLLRGIKDAADVKRMPPDKRDLAIKAMRNAQSCLEIAIRGENYRAGLKYAVHYTHVSAAFAASFLIRIARLFPHELNLRKTAKDVEELASVLEQVPAGRYARSLRLLLRRARKSKYLPPPSMPGSPNKTHSQLPQHRGSISSQSPWSGLGHPDLPTPTMQSGMSMTGHTTGMTPMLTQTSPLMSMTNISGKNESPSSNPESYEFDASFMQDLVNRAGLSFGNDQNLPLFLNGESLGETTENNNAMMGLEGFFLPPDVDLRFLDLNAFSASNASQLGEFQPDQDLPPDTWW